MVLSPKQRVDLVVRELRTTLPFVTPTDHERLRRVRKCLKLLHDDFLFTAEGQDLLADMQLLRSVVDLLPRVFGQRTSPDENTAPAADFAEVLLAWLLLRPSFALVHREELTLRLGSHFEAIVCAALRRPDGDRRRPLLEVVANQLMLQAYESDELLERSTLVAMAHECRPSDVFGRRVAALAALLPLDAARNELYATISDEQRTRSVTSVADVFGAAVEHSDVMRRRVVQLLGALDGVVAGPAEPSLLLAAVDAGPAALAELATATLLTSLCSSMDAGPTATPDERLKRISALRQLVETCDAAAVRRLKRDGDAFRALLDVAIAEPLARANVFGLLQRLYWPVEAAGYLNAHRRAALRAALADDPRADVYGDWPLELLSGARLGPAVTGG